ncbi:MAG: hypothetical protein LBJ63_02845 [Prevotellaceae bacterium]|jgi:hypothetical protein|nr:hypothetical protein [Prevotellaceae bacterium]
MIVEPKIFEGEIAIGQVESADVAARVQWFIDKYEPLFLRKLLGCRLADIFMEEYAKPVHDPKWDALADRVRYSIADYVYFYYQIDNETATVGIGEAVEQAENATRTTSKYKAVRAWNEMREMNLLFIEWMDINIYPEYKPRICDIFSTKNTFGL